MNDAFSAVADEARGCTICQPALAHTVRPICQGASSAVIRIIGQAPGTRVQASGRPFTDPSGDRLRDWLGVDETVFYDESRIAITPMGLCFPGLDDKGGDRPPRTECAPLWQDRFTQALPNVGLTLLIGQYAQKYYLRDQRSKSLTETVLRWREFWPTYAAMPHPSWRNNAWIRRNPWFEQDILPALKARVRLLLSEGFDRTKSLNNS